MENENSKQWAKIIDSIHDLEYAQSQKAEIFERERRDNIKQRYALLLDALKTGYAPESTLSRIALLGVEFGSCKGRQYLGGEPF